VAIGSVVLTSVFLGMTLPLMVMRYLVAALLVGMGVYCLVRHRHPRWVRMKVGFRDLTVWSFLMASAHGAGLMVVPVLLHSNTVEAQNRIADHNHMSQSVTPLAGMLATGIHTLAYLAVTGLLAWVVYRKLGLALLRKAWLNFDLVWAAALVATGVVTLLI
jgi:multisubunit Na+/H+ antiporter MnhC subunit